MTSAAEAERTRDAAVDAAQRWEAVVIGARFDSESWT
jgi:hypothetical protein